MIFQNKTQWTKTYRMKLLGERKSKKYHFAGSARGLYFPYLRFQSICSLQRGHTPVIAENGLSCPPTSCNHMCVHKTLISRSLAFDMTQKGSVREGDRDSTVGLMVIPAWGFQATLFWCFGGPLHLPPPLLIFGTLTATLCASFILYLTTFSINLSADECNILS